MLCWFIFSALFSINITLGMVNVVAYLSLLNLIAQLSIKVISGDWSYDESAGNGPSTWGRVNPSCDGQRQSPINLNWWAATPVFTQPILAIQDIVKRPMSITYANDGHGASVSFDFADGVQPTISGGPLGSDTFILHGMHMHWQSEHTIDSNHHEAELHMVYYNSKYGNIETALQRSDGLAVLAFLYYVSSLVKYIY